MSIIFRQFVMAYLIVGCAVHTLVSYRTNPCTDRTVTGAITIPETSVAQIRFLRSVMSIYSTHQGYVLPYVGNITEGKSCANNSEFPTGV
jgi:hypothetical protein